MTLGVVGVLAVGVGLVVAFSGGSADGPAAADFCYIAGAAGRRQRAEMRLRAVAAALGDKRGWPDDYQRSLDAFYESIPSDPKSEGIRQLMDVELDCKRKCDTSKIVATLPQIDALAEAAKLRPQGSSKSEPPPRLQGVPLQDRDFPCSCRGW
jgi:hypothetical protein